MIDLDAAHEFVKHNRLLLEKSSKCGCCYCQRVFETVEITKWVNGQSTGVCPFCNVDALIPEASGLPLTHALLHAVGLKWF